MAFIQAELTQRQSPRSEVKEARIHSCEPDESDSESLSRVADGIDKYVTGIGTALSGMKSIAFGNDSSFGDAVLLEGEYYLDVNIPASFNVQSEDLDIVIPPMLWILTKTSKLRIDNRSGYNIDASNMLALASFDRDSIDEPDSEEKIFIPQVEQLFDIQFNSYTVFTRASSLVNTMRDNNNGNPPKAFVVADFPT
jgi:hypothetical protein